MNHKVENLIGALIEEASSTSGALPALDKLLRDKWDWTLKPDIKEKFNKRFTGIVRKGDVFEAHDTKKNRAVILNPGVKSFVVVKDTGNQCGFLRGAVTASKRNN